MQQVEQSIGPGARIVARDAEWTVRRVERATGGDMAYHVTGVSEIVRGQEAILLAGLEQRASGIEVVDPRKTQLVPDASPHYRDTRLYLESLIRTSPPDSSIDGEAICVGHRAAMDVIDYQLEPAVLALRQPRQRILIGDAVGLGKTLEAGILCSELIRRGRGKRILVVTQKSMLAQFQKEFWGRFSIPLVRLDSVGIQRAKRLIPANHNPFYYFDRAIVSIDTLKNSIEYAHHIEQAWWDIIVIDEAHNVAQRGSRSQRNRLAELLAERSDTLIMLSATPHDGRPESFASLMNMLDATAIADPSNYTRADIEGLFVRRFKKDIRHQVKAVFPERETHAVRCTATLLEEDIYSHFEDMQFSRIDQRNTGNLLFKTTLQKALFSSPAACIETANRRIQSLGAEGTPEALHDAGLLGVLVAKLEDLCSEDNSKYSALLNMLKKGAENFSWSRDTNDRLVIFTERVATLQWLRERLIKDLKLKPEAVAELYGSMSDQDQMRVVEQFGQPNSPVRILVASDVASEGINLHYLSHRLVHYDMPWSLMTFQQRNGRIDRYGQKDVPHIYYLLTETQNEAIRGDLRILEVLKEKDEAAYQSIGDPSAFMGVYDTDAESDITGRAMEAGTDSEEFSQSLDDKLNVNLMELLFDDEEEDDGPVVEDEATSVEIRELPTIFPDDLAYVTDAVEFLREHRQLRAQVDADEQVLEISIPPELNTRLRQLPSEVRDQVGEYEQFVLSADRAALQREIDRCRQDESAWPRIHLMWDCHPIMEWMNQTVLTAFGRNEAPVVLMRDTLEPDETIFLMSGLIPNRKGHPILFRWFGVQFIGDEFMDVVFPNDLLPRLNLAGRKVPNTDAETDLKRLQSLIPDAVEAAQLWISEARDEFNAEMKPKLDAQLQKLDALKGRKLEQLELDFGQMNERVASMHRGRVNAEKADASKLFADYKKWIRDTMETEDKPFIRLVSVFAREVQA